MYRWLVPFILVILILLPYWTAPYLIASGYTVQPSVASIGIAILLHTLGVAIMMVSGGCAYLGFANKQMLRSITRCNIRKVSLWMACSSTFAVPIILVRWWFILRMPLLLMYGWMFDCDRIALASMAYFGLCLDDCVCYADYYKGKAYGKVGKCWGYEWITAKISWMGGLQAAHGLYYPLQVYCPLLPEEWRWKQAEVRTTGSLYNSIMIPCFFLPKYNMQKG